MDRRIERGDIWMYRFGKPNKRRPVVILSRQAALEHLHTAVVAPVTKQIRGIPSEVHVGIDEGLKTASVINLDHIYTVHQSELKKFVGKLDRRHMRQVCDSLSIALDCL